MLGIRTSKRRTMSRRILILAHTGRQKAMESALQAIELLREAGLTPVMLPHDAAVMHEAIHNGVLQANGLGVNVSIPKRPCTTLSWAWCWAAMARCFAPPKWFEIQPCH